MVSLSQQEQILYEEISHRITITAFNIFHWSFYVFKSHIPTTSALIEVTFLQKYVGTECCVFTLSPCQSSLYRTVFLRFSISCAHLESKASS